MGGRAAILEIRNRIELLFTTATRVLEFLMGGRVVVLEICNRIELLSLAMYTRRMNNAFVGHHLLECGEIRTAQRVHRSMSLTLVAW